MRIAFSGPTEQTELAQFALSLQPGLLLDHPSIILASSSDWQNLWRAVHRYTGLLEHIGLDDKAPIVSPTCGLDDVALQAMWFADLRTKLETGLQVVGDNSGAILLHRTGSILQVLLSQFEEELDSWDKVYYRSQAEDEPDLVSQYEDFLGEIPTLSRVIRLPRDLSLAKEQLQEDLTS